MTSFDADLTRQIEALRQQTEALRLSLRTQRPGCGCFARGVCEHHAHAWNALLEAEQALHYGIRALEASAYQNGDGERPGWWDADKDEEIIEALLEDVDIDLGDGEGSDGR